MNNLSGRYDFDIETDGLLNDVTKVHCLVATDMDTGVVFSLHEPDDIERFLKRLMGAERICGHNIVNFDLPALRKIYPWFKLNPFTDVYDTLLVSRLIYTDMADRDFRTKRVTGKLVGSHSLKAWGCRLGVLKGDFGETNDWSAWTQQMQDYCEQDVKVLTTLRKHLESKNYSAEAVLLEHQFAFLIQQMSERGFCFDVAAAGKLQATLSARRAQLVDELQKLVPPIVVELKTRMFWISKLGEEFSTKALAGKGATPGPFKQKVTLFNPLSRPQVARYLQGRGWNPSAFTDTGQAKVDEETLKGLDFEEGAKLAELFMIEKRLGQLSEGQQAWLLLERKGRIHGEVITNGAVTGRCTHRSPNVAQVPKVTSPYGRECRALFRPSPGMVLVGADASGLELRCLSHYLARYDNGAYAKLVCEGDVHTANQRAFGLPEGKPARDIAKTLIYAMVYGAGDVKLGLTKFPQASEKEAEQVGTEIRNNFAKGIVGFADLVNAVKTKAFGPVVGHRRGRNGKLYEIRKGGCGYLIGLDGRRLHVRSEHAALNTLLQSAGALLVKRATVIWAQLLAMEGLRWGEDFALLAHVHDEIQAEARPEVAELVGRTFAEALKAAGESWKFRCPLTGEFSIGNNWAETH